jgi:hypothetical protein
MKAFAITLLVSLVAICLTMAICGAVTKCSQDATERTKLELETRERLFMKQLQFEAALQTMEPAPPEPEPNSWSGAE